ncbi:MAG TPA: sugar-binding domain-containing protein [Chthonomonadaceae bacterium]|nr:sugar-binding domain-containing protein [Chthonomonadaceae bacterium]
MTSTGDKRRGRRPALDPTDRRRLAARIAKMVLVDRLEQKEILQQLTKSEPGLAHIDASTVSRLYRFALDTGIVRVHIDENAPFKPPRAEHLERELVAAYELQSAIVADTAGHEETLESNLADDRLHQALGQLCAEYLDTIVRQNEVVALSSGRAVFYACESLFNKHIFDKRNVRGVKVVSLNGNIAAEVWSMESPDARRAMDADISGLWLARAFPDAEPIRLSLPVAVKDSEMVHDWLGKGPGLWIAPEMWEEKAKSGNALTGRPLEEEVLVPTLALVGIGGVRAKSGHRFIVGLHEPMMANLQPELGKMIELIDDYAGNGARGVSCAIGDLCNRLFITLAARKSLPPAKLAELEGYVDAINARLLSVTFEQLYLVPKVVVVAGGASKADAIRSVLEWQAMGWKQPLVHDLCTDRETAVRLLEAKRAATRRSA